MTDKEYIERGALIAQLEKREREYDYADGNDLYPFVYGTLTGVRKSIICTKAAPAADVAEVRHAEWIAKSTMFRSPSARNYYCSACQYEPIEAKSYCPECGAKMDGERK